MLRKITPGELGEYLNATIIVLDQGMTYTLQRYLADSGCRILMEGKVERVEKTPEETVKPEDPEKQEETKPKKRGPKPGQGRKKFDGSAEEKILKAWAGGERTVNEIKELTGYSLATIYKYIPRTKNG